MSRGFTSSRKRKTAQAGFTLVELMLVVSLVSLVTLMSGAFYSRFLTQNAVLNTEDQVVSQLRQAQVYAMSGKQNSNWGVSFNNHLLTLYSGSSYSARNSAFDQLFTVNNNISVTGLTDVNFARAIGRPASSTITILGNNTSKTVTVNAEGGVSR